MNFNFEYPCVENIDDDECSNENNEFNLHNQELKYHLKELNDKQTNHTQLVDETITINLGSLDEIK